MLETRPKMPTDTKATSLAELRDFSLVSGGGLYQLWRRTRLSGDALQFTHRRMLVAVLVTWAPLLLLSIAEGHAWVGSVALAFVQDFETNVRLLIAAPLLLLAEVTVHRGLLPIVRRFVDNGLIPDAARPQFDAAIASAMRLRNSVVAELLLIAFVFGVGIPFIWRDQVALDVNSWYAVAEGGRLLPTYAGWWAALVSMPVFQFLMLRWYFRMFIWARFLWQVAHMDLNLQPNHPDGAAGLSFLALAERAYRPVLLALGSVLAGMMANRIFYAGASLLEFKVEIFGTVALLVFSILGPMLVFVPPLRAARRKGLAGYSHLGQRYAQEFDRKWMGGESPPDEPLLGSADIQSLADLRNAFLVVKGMNIAPFDLKTIIALMIFTLLPVAPLLLTTFSAEQILDRVLNTLF